MTSGPDDPTDDIAFARRVLDDGRYLVLASADGEGNPWPAPLWYAREGREIVWVSRRSTRHSSNLATRSTVGLVVFETPVPTAGRTRAVYAEATAGEVPEADLERCLDVYDRRSRAEGMGPWPVERVVPPADMRLYRAVVSRFFVLEPDRDLRREVELDL
ncbi:pyridoxamine 5'-phosphate oxidase family protein [Isoptericola sp. 4D.3]|jgi:nitroimidazol reductase NimA-like FMN-containing flavoprotein (pyridoxamine 5'-phosphate oxidase superfamily)|uniref:Pyridoxamine 5'-phosphate oxidase family protein n=1 Tax=Isoptericola peretonis TaxID=2918523 RepID=A0ABT0J8U0_9MICO|nr:pyridoxamine 5'-phosphate oxidase family protein [Isoptericola sp. 4D.3]